MLSLTTFISLFLGSCIGTGIFRRYALRYQLLDIPNARSSHTKPMPRGGGIVFVMCFEIALLAILEQHQIATPWFIVMVTASIVIALIGLIDDYIGLSALLRLTIQILVASMLVQSLSIMVFADFLHYPGVFFLKLLAALFLVWSINLFNFMDGIDGIASLQAISVCLGGAWLFFLEGDTPLLVFPLLLATVIAGFLVWNFPRAKIFMGDVGSGFIGMFIALFTLVAARDGLALFCGWLILNAVFYLDATLTLLARLYYRKNLLQAHCTHAYQHAAQRYQKHWIVGAGVVGINCCWLLPFAIMVQQGWISSGLGLLCAYLPVAALVFWFKPGQ